MPAVIRSLLGSKKFCAFLVTLVVLVLTRKLGLDEATATELGREIVALGGSLILGQGIADHGKESEIVKKSSGGATA